MYQSYKTLLAASLLLTTVMGVSASPKIVPSKYDRCAVSVILLNPSYYDHNQKKVKKKFTNIRINAKYDINTLQTKEIESPLYYTTKKKFAESIRQSLEHAHVGNQCIATFFSRKKDGTMSADLLKERGLYNAKDADVYVSKASKRGIAYLMDLGEELIGKSYIVVISYSDLDSKSFEGCPAFNGKATAYLYKVKFNEEIQANIYDNLWIFPEDDAAVKSKKRAAFDATTFPIEYITSTNIEAYSVSGKDSYGRCNSSSESVLEEFLQESMDKIFYFLDKKYEDFRVKTPLYERNPLRAKIGSKEGLHIDQRYFAFEYVYNEKTNSTVAKRRGVIRVKKVINNYSVASGNSPTSEFYQVAGGYLEPGYLLQQRNDYGVGVIVGCEYGAIGGYHARIEKSMGRLFNITSLFGYFSISNQTVSYNFLGMESHNYDVEFLRFELGVGRGFHFWRNFEFAPFLAVGIESASNSKFEKDWEFKDNNLNIVFYRGGAILAMNLSYNLQLMGGVGYYYMPKRPYYFVSDEKSKDFPYKYNEVFPGREGGNFLFGARFQF